MAIDNTFIADWESYFQEMHSFVSSLGYGRVTFANQSYTEYVMERLESCIRSISVILEYVEIMHDEEEELDEEEAQIILTYKDQFCQLLSYLRHIFAEWQAHFDHLQIHIGYQGDTAYHLPITHSGRCGLIKKIPEIQHFFKNIGHWHIKLTHSLN